MRSWQLEIEICNTSAYRLCPTRVSALGIYWMSNAQITGIDLPAIRSLSIVREVYVCTLGKNGSCCFFFKEPDSRRARSTRRYRYIEYIQVYIAPHESAFRRSMIRRYLRFRDRNLLCWAKPLERKGKSRKNDLVHLKVPWRLFNSKFRSISHLRS